MRDDHVMILITEQMNQQVQVRDSTLVLEHKGFGLGWRWRVHDAIRSHIRLILHRVDRHLRSQGLESG